MASGRGDFHNNHHEDFHNWANGNIHNHGNWYHGCWNGSWGVGAGWNHLWNNYPVATAFGLTAWGVNRVAYGWGYWGVRDLVGGLRLLAANRRVFRFGKLDRASHSSGTNHLI